MNKNNTHAHTYIQTLEMPPHFNTTKEFNRQYDTIPKAINDIHSQTDGKI